jgi:predicted nucleic acid-binding protein
MHPRYVALTRPILSRIQAGKHKAVISTVALMELTVHPWRQTRFDVAQQYEAALIHFPNLQMADVTRQVARRAARLRAEFNLKPADALQVGTALVHEATVFVTNDKQLRKVNQLLAVLVLEDFT